jgi:nifR3 family TIM-barrel protein
MRLPYAPAVDTPLILAPMAGISEPPFRQICRNHGADVLMTEFLAAEAIRRGIRKTLEGCEFAEIERPIGVQIYGADPDSMARAAAIVTEVYRPDFIDINFGCPVKKVVQRNGGSGCLRDLALVERIIRDVVAATDIPVTVKTRSGWSEESRQPVEIALRMQDAGAKAFTLHARTRTQMFSGKASWDEIAAVVEALDIPVIGNGDIQTASDIARMRDHTRCAAIMIGRGTFGNPWLFGAGRAALSGEDPLPPPSPGQRFAVALEHASLALTLQGDSRKTVVEFRKHLGWYTKGLPQAAGLRERLFQVETMAAAAAIFRDYLERTAVLV